jgi:hypothetical protein
MGEAAHKSVEANPHASDDTSQKTRKIYPIRGIMDANILRELEEFCRQKRHCKLTLKWHVIFVCLADMFYEKSAY